MTPRKERIFHIATPDDAERLRGDGVLEPASLRTEGFVHCSTLEQVVATTAPSFDPDAELVLLELDVDAAADSLRWSEVYRGEQFPHLHAPVLASAIVCVHPWAPEDRARWRSGSR